ncbi:MAG: hypothetical protein AB7P03_28095 [Kofleriaceae bacterium]
MMDALARLKREQHTSAQATLRMTGDVALSAVLGLGAILLVRQEPKQEGALSAYVDWVPAHRAWTDLQSALETTLFILILIASALLVFRAFFGWRISTDSLSPTAVTAAAKETP